MHFKVLFSLFLLFGLASAASPWYIGDMDAEITFKGSIGIERQADSKLNWVEASYYLVPQDNLFQSFELIEAHPDTFSMGVDQFGNKFVKFTWQKPTQDVLDYELKWRVKVDRFKYAVTSDMPPNSYPQEVQRYQDVDNLTWWTGFMKQKAESLKTGQKNDLESVRAITDWVSSTVVYDRAYWEKAFTAERVFKERRGVCDEFTSLFLSLCRSLGMPAMYIEGLVFSGDEWNFHAWAEVYINSWIPVDATYNEAGFVDASHIVLARVHNDNNVQNSLKWEGRGVEIHFEDDEFEINVINSSVRAIVYAEVDMPGGVVASEIFNVTASLDNLANSHVIATCSINMPQEMILLDSKEKSKTLAPNGTGELVWRVAAPETIEPKLPHVIPIQVLCFPGFNVTKEITYEPREMKPGVSKASVIDLTAINSSYAIVTVRNEGTRVLQGAVLSFCVEKTDKSCMNQTLGELLPGQTVEVFFTGADIKEGDKLTAELSSADFKKSAIEVSMESLKDAKTPDEENKTQAASKNMSRDEDLSSQYAFIIILIIIVAAIIAVAAIKSARS